MKKLILVGSLGREPGSKKEKNNTGPMPGPVSSAAGTTVSFTDKSQVCEDDGAHDGCTSTSIYDQHAFILKALRVGPKTTYELRRGGSFQPPTRIFELRELGYNIETTRVSVTDRDGFTHVGVARYELVAEPGGSGA